ncbi:glucosamine-6-phosphate deaminase [Gelidibacter algens]|uniref:Glucosamine-6-phosphate deaminase n=1 Tax=Gelidibacter algens TaxID=49280 RepID=A0A1A7R1B7_9FLAO|nr:6-phosphogluconolactonase [Gelidibacter algens]OBX26050.1 glucosamine-6-phosphate deaminase [Gelidibacter algens]RAJ27677.1 glucosamine-6-phosphate deaminase [Gelidibacter algens]
MPNLNRNINVFPDRITTGTAAGKAVETCIENLQKTQDTVRIIFAAAPSQDSMLDYLTKSTLIDWNRIIAFNMDEYIGLKPNAPELFSSYLENALFSKVSIKHKNTIRVDNGLSTEIERYAKLLTDEPIDIVCLGIGENGHIAFNDPPVADFNDPKIIKVVELDEECRLQQVNDGCFDSIKEVPEKAITLTIPTLLKGKNLFCVVIGIKKSNAVKNALLEPISTACPASILTKHPNCNFFFDKDAYKEAMRFENV